ncbi:MAG: tetratricopeptide repeat protein [Deltaproteobacteria bacterium]|nr:tetratricopeptide repeat protein [Deltaproteobacteria bacterium]
MDGAKAAYRLAMDAGLGARDPEPLAWVTVEAARVFLAEGDVETAQAGFQQALTVFPEYPPARVGVARVALARGRPAEAARQLEAAFEESALAETAWLWAEALEAAGADATTAWARAEKIGRHGEGRVLAALLGSRARDLEEGLRAVERELTGRGDHLTHDAHALVLLRLGRIPEARAALDAARALAPREPQVILHEGLLLLAEGQAEAARARLEDAWGRRAALFPSQVAELKAARARLAAPAVASAPPSAAP